MKCKRGERLFINTRNQCIASQHSTAHHIKTHHITSYKSLRDARLGLCLRKGLDGTTSYTRRLLLSLLSRAIVCCYLKVKLIISNSNNNSTNSNNNNNNECIVASRKCNLSVVKDLGKGLPS